MATEMPFLGVFNSNRRFVAKVALFLAFKARGGGMLLRFANGTDMITGTTWGDRVWPLLHEYIAFMEKINYVFASVLIKEHRWPTEKGKMERDGVFGRFLWRERFQTKPGCKLKEAGVKLWHKQKKLNSPARNPWKPRKRCRGLRWQVLG